MKSILNEKAKPLSEEVKYPILLRSPKLVVMATGSLCFGQFGGFVVHSSDVLNPVESYSESWNPTMFLEFNGEIVLRNDND